jgi:hypothetical protein
MVAGPWTAGKEKIMTPHSSPRRLLLVAALVASLASLAFAPRAEARLLSPPHAARVGDSFLAACDFVRGLLHSVWANAGSSLDPLGVH